MEIFLHLKSKESGIVSTVLFPLDEDDLRERFELKPNSPMEFIVLENIHKLFRDEESFEILNKFAEMVEDIDEDIVFGCVDHLGYKAYEFVGYSFAFEDCYILPDVNTLSELGGYFVDEVGIQNLPKDQLESYFDYEMYGRDINIENFGGFVDSGYIMILN